jgi:hypothetical protein
MEQHLLWIVIKESEPLNFEIFAVLKTEEGAHVKSGKEHISLSSLSLSLIPFLPCLLSLSVPLLSISLM